MSYYQLFFPMLLCSFKNFFDRLTCIELSGNIYIIARFAVKKGKKSKGSSRTKLLIQCFNTSDSKFSIIHDLPNSLNVISLFPK